MGNRYTKTAFTARQVKTLKSMRHDIHRILLDRNGKQDNPKALVALHAADTAIMTALNRAEEWKNSK